MAATGNGDYADFVMPEIYKCHLDPECKDTDWDKWKRCEKNTNKQKVGFQKVAERLDRFAPGLKEKIVFGLAANSTQCDEEFRVYTTTYMLRNEIKEIAKVNYNKPVEPPVPAMGIAFFVPRKLTFNSLTNVDEQIKESFKDRLAIR